jgi:oligopeptide transport system substrate-binding protein
MHFWLMSVFYPFDSNKEKAHMKFRKKYTLQFLPALLCLVAMLVAACGSQGAQGQGQKAPNTQQSMRIAFEGGNGSGDITTIDPALDSDLPSNQVISLAFTGLVQLNNNLKIQPQLALSWDTSPDGLKWTFHLKPDLKFSDGNPLDANDVAYSINRALSPNINNLSGGLASTYLGLIKDAIAFTTGGVGAPTTLIGDSIKIIDPNTLELDLSHSTGYFLDALAYPTSWVVEKSVIGKWGDTKWTDHLADNGGQGGDGPFKVLSYDHNSGIKFVPNPTYYGSAPALQQVSFDFYKTVETGYKAYQAKQVDWSVVPPAQVNADKFTLGSQYHQHPTLIEYYVAMNYLAKPFNNIKIRQAFELAINKDILNESVERGIDIPTCHIVPNGMPGYNANLKCPLNAPTSGNTKEAKILLQQGMQEEGITSLPPIKYTYRSNNTVQADIATVLLNMWQTNLGVNIETNTMDFGPLLKAESQSTCATPATPAKCLDQGLQMWFAGWAADYPDPQDWTSLQFGNGQGYNEFNYGQNAALDAPAQVQAQRELAAADVMPNGDARYSAYNAPEQQLVNDVAWLPLFQFNGEEAIRPYVVGYPDNAQQIVAPDDWSKIFITVH